MRVIVCGGRGYSDFEAVRRAIREVWLTNPVGTLVIIHGAATGADTLAGVVAHAMGLTVERFPAEWSRFGAGAGPIRNRKMLDSGCDLVLAFPGGKGTANMCQQARAAGVRVMEVGR